MTVRSQREPDGQVVHRISPSSDALADRLFELARSRDLFMLLLQRELSVRYKQTFLGAAWVILQPLVPATIFATVLGAFAQLPSAGTPYLLFALTGLVLFGLFAGVVSRAGGSLTSDSRLITKVYFPRSVLPLAAGSAAIVDFVVGLAVVGVCMAAFGQFPGVEIVALPIVVGLVLVAAFGIGLAVAGLSAYYRDFAYLVPFLLQVLLYASPIIYSTELVPGHLRSALALNPLVPLTEAFRWTLLGTPPPTVPEALLGALGSVLLFVAGAAVFDRTTRNLTDVI